MISGRHNRCARVAAVRDPYREAPLFPCPKCAKPLQEIEGVVVCDAACRGELLPYAVFTHGFRERRMELVDLGPSSKVCPRCGVALLETVIETDGERWHQRYLRCHRDGVWRTHGGLCRWPPPRNH